jgi:type VI secretion system protein ImpK
VTNQPPKNSAGNLALIFQEIITATVRLRANRQPVSDAESFRVHIREALKTAQQQSRAQGYSDDDFRKAVLAVVALLDESILNSGNPKFTDWPRRPLQEELFKEHKAGEKFFEDIQQLLAQTDSAALADVLEVHDLCLLLGYGGRYSFGNKGELHSIRELVAAKIRRIRPYNPALAPDWAPPVQASVRSQTDPWVRRFAYAAIACVVLMLVVFISFKVVLSGRASDVHAIAATR